MPTTTMTDAWIKSLKPDAKRVEYYDTQVKGGSLVLQVSTTGTKTWFVRYRAGTGREAPTEKMKLGTYSKEYGLEKARKEARKIIARVDNGENPAAERREEKQPKPEPEPGPAALTFQKLWDRYVAESALEGKDRSYDASIGTHVLPALKDTPVADITRRVVSDLYGAIIVKAQAKGRKGTSANRAMNVLSRVFNFGIDRGLCEHNPATGLKRRVEEKPRTPNYDDDQLRALWAAFEQEAFLPQAGLKLRLLTGQRGGEVDAMQWAEVRDGVWTIPPSRRKNRLEHKVPLPRQAREILESLRPTTGDGPYVFPSEEAESGHLVLAKHARQRLRRNSGIDELNPHDLRHVVVTRLLKKPLSVPSHIASAVVGHVDRQMARATRIYDSNEYLEEKAEALQAWADRLEAILKEKPKDPEAAEEVEQENVAPLRSAAEASA